MAKAKELPSVEYLRECFDYNPETGDLIWKVRPLGHFSSVRGCSSANGCSAGKKAGYLKENGYFGVSSNGVLFLAHRIIWKLTTGKDPICCIDHINGIRNDNRLCNLREATNAENCRNKKMNKNNTTGFKGVVLLKFGTHGLKTDRYRAQMTINGKSKNLGSFDTPEQACEVYRQASNLHYGEFSNHG